MFDGNEDGEIDFEEEMHRTIGTVAIKDDVLYVADFLGTDPLPRCKGNQGWQTDSPFHLRHARPELGKSADR